MSTLGALFAIPDGTPDPAHPGEYLAGPPSEIPVPAFPNGACSAVCEPGQDACGECGACEQDLGGPTSYAEIGLGAAVFVSEAMGSGSVCRPRCLFDPANDGSCPDGYTCSAQGVCLESCVSDDHCNAAFGLSRSAGLVAFERPGTPFSCNASTGRCEWTAPSSATVGDACSHDGDCPQDIGRCVEGLCITLACDLPAFGCPPNTACFASGDASTACLPLCDSAADCPAPWGCAQLGNPTDGYAGVCVPGCEDSGECRGNEACNEDALCEPTCTNESCAAPEICDPGSTGDSFCRAPDKLCFSTDDCVVGQACRVDSNDFYGRCGDACLLSTDCDTAASEQCVIPMGDDRGVCRAPAGPCSFSPNDVQPLRGDAQCIPSQVCDTMTVDVVGTCVDP